MFKKILCWLLIIQHINIYILQAATGDISVLFAEEEESSKCYRSQLISPIGSNNPLKAKSLKISSENQSGVLESIYDGLFKFENGHFHVLERDHLNPSLGITLTNSNTLHLTSSLADNQFSIHLNENGKILLQAIDTLRHLKFDTWGSIQTDKQKVKASALSLNGKSIYVNGELEVDYLNLTAANPYEKIVNGPEGLMNVKKQAHVKFGNETNQGGGLFENNGRILGENNSFFDLHDNSFSNDYIAQQRQKDFRAKVEWQGNFSFLNVYSFYNYSDILPAGSYYKKFGVLHIDNSLEHALYINARTLYNNSNGIIASNYKVFINCIDVLNNQGIIKASITHYVVKGFKNDGIICSDKFNLIADYFTNKNQIHIAQKGKITQREGGEGLRNTKEALISSKGKLHIKGGNLNNEGDADSQGVITANELTTINITIQNSGQIIVLEKGDIKGSNITNTKTGKINFLKEGEVAAEEVTNENTIIGQIIKICVTIYKNIGSIISTTLSFDISKSFTNEKNALVATTGETNFTGDGEVVNHGKMQSKGKTDINTRSTSNEGQIVSEKEVVIRTNKTANDGEKDFDNNGLILAPKIQINSQNGSNIGIAGKETDLNITYNLKGIIATDSLALTTEGRFHNLGHMVGANKVKLDGSGTFTNDGDISQSNHFTSDVREFTNNGNIHIKSVLSFGDKTELLKNSGDVISDGVLDIYAKSKIDNEGLIEGRSGAASVVTSTLDNKGRLNALGGLFTLKVDNGENHRNIYGQKGIDLNISQKFSNTKDAQILSLEELSLKGSGGVTNDGSMQGKGKIDVHVQNTTNNGKIVSEKEIEIRTNKAAGNKDKDLDNTGLILAPKIDIHSKNGSNSGPINQEVDLNLIDGIKGIVASNSLNFTTDDTFQNNGHIIGGKRTDIMGSGSFVNNGEINKTDKLNSTVKEFDNKGIVRTYDALTFEKATDVLTNSGLILSDGALNVASRLKIDNGGIIEGRSGQTTIETSNLTNKGLLSSLAGRLTIKVEEGQNHKNIYGRDGVDLTVSKTFDNTGEIHASGSLKTDGKGVIDNKKLMSSDSGITLSNEKVSNHADIQANGKIEVLGAKVDNLATGKIISKSDVEVAETANLSNKGTVSSEGTITYNPAAFDNEGRFEAQKDILLPNAHTFNNKKDAVVFSEKGKISLPKLKVFVNDGDVTTPGAINLTTLDSFQNNGAVQTGNLLSVTTKESLVNNKKLYGRSGVILNGNEVTNSANVVSDGNVGIKAPKIDNTGLVHGQKGATVIASQTFTQGATGKVHSPAGIVKLEGNEHELAGEVAGKRIEVRSNSKKLDDKNVKFLADDDLVYDVPQGWDYGGESREFANNLTVHGPILSPAALKIKGNFNWNGMNALSNYFDIIVDGKLQLDTSGHEWLNYARVQAAKGSNIKASKFGNRGTFYSALKTIFDVRNGFDNYSQIEVVGDCDILAPMGDITNHPGAGFRQRKSPGATNLVKFVGQNVRATSSTIMIDGKINSASTIPNGTFVIEKPAPREEVVNRNYTYQSGKRSNTTVSRPATRYLPQGERAIFSAEEADIKASLLKNVGSTISITNDINFAGGALQNLTQEYKEIGTRVEGTTDSHDKKNGIVRKALGKKKKKKTTYGCKDVPYAVTISEPSVARIYSRGEMRLNIGGNPIQVGAELAQQANPHIHNTGDIRARTLLAQGGALNNMALNGLDGIVKPIPTYKAAASYFDETQLQGPSFWKLDAQNVTAFRIIPNKPLNISSEEEIRDQLSATGHSAAAPQSRGLPASWEPAAADVATFASALTSSSLMEVAPRIALFANSRLKGGEKFHYHPALLAETVAKCFVDTIGFASPSHKIRNEDLLARTLEEMGYINARRIHGQDPVPAPGNFERMPVQDQLSQQIRAVIAPAEVEQFKDPAIVYALREDFGESVLSAQVTFPRALREAFNPAFGRIAANYLSIDNKDIENSGTLSGNIIKLKAENDIAITKGHVDGGASVSAVAGNTLSVQSGTVEADKVDIEAKNVIAETLSKREYTPNGYIDRLQAPTTIKARTEELVISAVENLQAIGANLQSKKTMTLEAGNILDLGSQTAESEQTTQTTSKKGGRHTTTTTQTSSLNHHKTNLDAGGDIIAKSGGDMYFNGLKVKAGGNFRPMAGGKLFDRAVHNHFHSTTTTVSKPKRSLGSTLKSIGHYNPKKDFLFASKNKGKEELSRSTPDVNSYEVGGDLDFRAKGDLEFEAPIFKSGGKTSITSDEGNYYIKAVKAYESFSSQKSGKSLVWQSNKDKGHVDQNAKYAQILAKGGFTVQGGKGSKVDKPGSLKSIAKNPEYAWMQELEKNPNIEWNTILEEHKKWDHKSQGMTAAAAVVVSIVVGAVTGGAGAAIGGVMGSMVSAAVQTIASQAAVALINNQGNVGKTLHDLGSKDNIKAFAASVVSAGVMQGVSGALKLPNKPVGFTQHLQKNALNAGVKASVNVAQGQDVKRSLVDGLKGAAIGAAAGWGANQISEARAAGDLDSLGHKIAHAGLGGAMGFAISGTASGAGAGAMAAVVAETVAEVYRDSVLKGANGPEDVTPDKWDDIQERGIALAKIAGVAAVALAGQDKHADLAAQVGGNAAENNAFFIPVILGGIALYEAYDIIDTYQKEGPEAALFKLGLAVTLAATGGIAAKTVFKIGGKVFQVCEAEAAWAYCCSKSPMLMKTAENLKALTSKAGAAVAEADAWAGKQFGKAVGKVEEVLGGAAPAKAVPAGQAAKPIENAVENASKGVVKEANPSAAAGNVAKVEQQVVKDASSKALNPATNGNVHKNSLAYEGETHVYAIKNVETGKIHKVGESAQGVRKSDGASKRAESQARKLQRETGERHRSKIIKTLPNKQSGRDHEGKVIKTFKKVFGDDALPGNKNNR